MRLKMFRASKALLIVLEYFHVVEKFLPTLQITNTSKNLAV